MEKEKNGGHCLTIVFFQIYVVSYEVAGKI